MGAVKERSWADFVKALKHAKCTEVYDDKPCGGDLLFLRYRESHKYDIGCSVCGSCPQAIRQWNPLTALNATRAMIYMNYANAEDGVLCEIRSGFWKKRQQARYAAYQAAMQQQRESMRGIPTVYNSIQFRSRLEAKWAYFFDLIGWPYQYEPFELDGYIPDFVLTFSNPVLVEVKPVCSISEVAEKCEKPIITAWNENRRILIVGGNIRHEQQHPKTGARSVGFNAGWFALGQDEIDLDNNVSPAPFMRCQHCKGFSTYPTDGIRSCFRCGHMVHCHDAESSLFANGDHIKLLNLWQRACNAVQYNKPHATEF